MFKKGVLRSEVIQRFVFLTKGPLQPVVGARRLRDLQTLQILAQLRPVLLCEWTPENEPNIPAHDTLLPEAKFPIERHFIGRKREHPAILKMAAQTMGFFQTEFDSDYSPEIRTFLNSHLKDGDALWASRLRMMQHIEDRLSTHFPTFLDVAQVEGDLKLDEVLSDPSQWAYIWRAYRCARYEKSQITRAAHVFVSTDIDQARLKSASPNVEVSLLTSTLVRPTYTRNLIEKPNVRPQKLILVGGDFDYKPAYEGLLWLHQEVYPRIKAHYSAQGLLPPTFVIGSHNAPTFRKNPCDPFSVAEYQTPEERDALYRSADLSVFPMRTGRGSRMPILEAMAHALPIVASGRASDGIHARPGIEFVLVDDPDSYTTAILRLLRDSGFRKSLGTAARSYYLMEHDAESLRPKQIEMIAQITRVSSSGEFSVLRNKGQITPR